MPQPIVDGTCSALVLFADVIDSSRYSSVLGYEEYAARLIEYQQDFETVAGRYFPPTPASGDTYRQVRARGDEGVIFVVNPGIKARTLLYRAVTLAFHLRGRMRFGLEQEPGSSGAPRQIDIGAGIHYGTVARAMVGEGDSRTIGQIEGYDINYAKRVESCSRSGRYSQILVSCQAARLLTGTPLIFSRLRQDMKGIGTEVEICEVQSGLLAHLLLRDGDEKDERLVDHVNRLAADPSQMDEPWLTTLVVSTLEALISDAEVPASKAEYQRSQSRVARHNPSETDPLLLYVRARDYASKGQWSQQVRYLRNVLKDYPEFVHARIALVEACAAILESGDEQGDKVYARDVAREFLEHYRGLLQPDEEAAFARVAGYDSGR